MSAGTDDTDAYRLAEVAEIRVETPDGTEVYSNGVEFLLDLDRYDDVLDICYAEDVGVEGDEEFTIQVYDNEWHVSPEEVEEMAENYQDALDDKAALREEVQELEDELDSIADKHKDQKEELEKLRNEVEDYRKGLARLGTVDEIYDDRGKIEYTPEGSSHSKVREMRDDFLQRVDEGDRLLLDNKTLAIQEIFEKYDEAGSGYEVDDEALPDISFDDIGGLDDQLDTLERKLVLQQEFPDVYGEDGVLESTGGLLLYGPPGTGKTMSVQALANEHDMDFYAINGPEVMTKWVGQAEENIRRVAESARESAP
ncbi:MAG: AAA family ATPase, partial [Candidatus Nanohaloarchaeota archaeon QJJ-5]|nr:AAA family ATPase [Candidatus Nanohaloarchaeota archaeon QJJ-5]